MVFFQRIYKDINILKYLPEVFPLTKDELTEFLIEFVDDIKKEQEHRIKAGFNYEIDNVFLEKIKFLVDKGADIRCNNDSIFKKAMSYQNMNLIIQLVKLSNY